MHTKQMDFWGGEFGAEYTKRNPHNAVEANALCMEQFGIERTSMYNQFFTNIPKTTSVLEVGCNVGAQMDIFYSMGYTNIKGIELQEFAVEKGKEFNPHLDIRQGSGFEIPFEDNSVDFVYTSGVLIHISPLDYDKIMGEMNRVSKKYIFGFEYYADSITNINYRGNEDYLWKCNFAQEFINRYPDLKLVKQEFYPYIMNNELGNKDVMYLLEKTSV